MSGKAESTRISLLQHGWRSTYPVCAIGQDNFELNGVCASSSAPLLLFPLLNSKSPSFHLVPAHSRYITKLFSFKRSFYPIGMLINVLIAWVYLTLVFFGGPTWLRFGRDKAAATGGRSEKNRDNVTKLLKQKYKDLGPMTFHEKWVGGLFLLVVMLWLFRDPKFIKGWKEYILSADVGDSTAAMLVVLLLFVIPNSMSYFRGGTSSNSKSHLVGTCY